MKRFYPKYDPSLALATLSFVVAVTVWIIAMGSLAKDNEHRSASVVVGTIVVPTGPALQLASSTAMAGN